MKKNPAVLFFLTLFVGAAMASAKNTVLVPGGDLRPFWIEPKKRGQDKPGAESIPVRAFHADVRAVTNGEFASFVKSHPRWKKEAVSPLFADEAYLSQFQGGSLKKGVPPDAPAGFVSWFAAKAYCESRGMRLPTTSEWEYMAAASEDSRDATNDPRFLARILEWYSETRSGDWVGKGPGRKNLYGVEDLHGSIWEWVDDFNSNLVTGESREDGSFNRDMFCGAGSLSGGNKENYAAFMRFAFRTSLKGRSSIWNLGFRCVQEARP